MNKVHVIIDNEVFFVDKKVVEDIKKIINQNKVKCIDNRKAQVNPELFYSK